MMKAVKSIRGRTCNECRGEIPAGEGCIEYKSNSWYRQVACVHCVTEVVKEAREMCEKVLPYEWV